jgi:hypothetical protein
MRPTRSTVAAAVSLALACGASPALAEAQATDQDSAVGNVITDVFRGVRFVFDAHSGPSGENPSGTATFVELKADIFARGPVTCLTVTGNRATIGFDNQEPGSGPLNPEAILFFVEDNGTPGVGTDKVQEQFVGVVPTVCPPNTVVYRPEVDTVEVGDLTVHDAPAVPTSKDQCKHGGWKIYGVFKNEGDCVSFVAKKGKNQPSRP